MPRLALYSARSRGQQMALVLGLSLAMSVFIAAGLAMAVRDMPSFSGNLLYSLAIGASVALCSVVIDACTPWPAGLRRWRLLLTLLVSTPLGYALGSFAARVLSGGSISAENLWQAVGHPAGVLVTALASLAVAAIGVHQGRMESATTARVNAQRLAAEAELRALRAQLDPHLLFNTLAHLRALVEEEPALALEMIDHLMPYLRDTLTGARQDNSSLQAEFERLRHYLQLMSMRMGARLTWDLQLPAELRDLAVPSMLLQPLVENAVQHGVAERTGPGWVNVAARLDDGALVIAVRNSGGLAAARSLGGYGLAHVRERLRALHGDEARCEIDERPGPEVCVLLRVPA